MMLLTHLWYLTLNGYLIYKVSLRLSQPGIFIFVLAELVQEPQSTLCKRECLTSAH